MAVHIRNTLMGKTSFANNYQGTRALYTLREIFFAGKWTEVTKTNPTEWANNEALINTDGAVLAANPYRITSATGGFTGMEDYGITVLASNDQNRGVYRIDRVISDTEVSIQPVCAPPDGWVDESGMTIRCFNWGEDDRLTTNTILVMKCPTGTVEAFFRNGTTSYYMQVNVYPDGYQSGAGHDIGQEQFNWASGGACIRWNAHFDGNAALLYFYVDDNAWEMWNIGELDDTLAGDTYPGYGVFHSGIGGMTDPKLLSADDWSTPVTFKVANRSRGIQTTRQTAREGAREVKGKVQLIKPWVYGEGAQGGYFRGRIPNIRFSNLYWETFRPMDADRTWRHLESGVVVPMNGENDPKPLATAWTYN